MTGLLALVASLCSVGPISGPATVGAQFDDAHIAVAAGERRRCVAQRLRRRTTHPVRPQARRRSRCLAHVPRTVPQRLPRLAPPTGPPVHRGPPTG